MSETVSAVPAPSPVFDPQSVQLAQAAQLANSVDASNSASFLAAVNHASTADTTTPTSPAAPSRLDANAQASVNAELNTAEGAGLLNLSTDSLSLLNEFGTEPRNASVTGNLTTQQLQSIGILQEDAVRLEEAAGLTLHTPLAEAATTVDLSLTAQGIADGILPSQQLSANAQVAAGINTTLTTTQLQQIGTILAPLANQPLTEPLFIQLQTQVANAGFSPLQFSLRTIFLALQYVAGLLPASSEANAKAAVKATEEMDTEMTVQPVSSVGAAAVENDTLRSQV